MPRKRQGPPGTAGLRTDTNTQSVVAPTGMAYGDHKASVDAQTAVPLPQQGGGTGAPPMDMAAAIQAARDHSVAPSNFGAPTTMPEQPLTHGAPVGPGPGPVGLIGVPTPVQTLSSLLSAMASSSESNPDVQFLARYVAGGRT